MKEMFKNLLRREPLSLWAGYLVGAVAATVYVGLLFLIVLRGGCLVCDSGPFALLIWTPSWMRSLVGGLTVLIIFLGAGALGFVFTLLYEYLKAMERLRLSGLIVAKEKHR